MLTLSVINNYAFKLINISKRFLLPDTYRNIRKYLNCTSIPVLRNLHSDSLTFINNKQFQSQSKQQAYVWHYLLQSTRIYYICPRKYFMQVLHTCIVKTTRYLLTHFFIAQNTQGTTTALKVYCMPSDTR